MIQEHRKQRMMLKKRMKTLHVVEMSDERFRDDDDDRAIERRPVVVARVDAASLDSESASADDRDLLLDELRELSVDVSSVNAFSAV